MSDTIENGNRVIENIIIKLDVVTNKNTDVTNNVTNGFNGSTNGTNGTIGKTIRNNVEPHSKSSLNI